MSSTLYIYRLLCKFHNYHVTSPYLVCWINSTHFIQWNTWHFISRYVSCNITNNIVDYCTLCERIKDKNSILSAIKCQVCCIKNTAWWLTNIVQLRWLVCGKQAHYYSFPCTYMDFYHLIHGFTKLSTTVKSYCLLLHDKWPPLTMHLSLCSADSPVYSI